MTEKKAIKIVLDMARRYALARFMQTCEKKNPIKTSKSEAKAMQLLSEKLGNKYDDQSEVDDRLEQ